MTVASSRSFARVEARLPLRVRVVDDDRAGRIMLRAEEEPTYTEWVRPESSAPGEGSWERAALATLLRRVDALEETLARIAETVGAEPGEASAWIEGESVAFSGSGLGALIPRRLSEGDRVELEISLLGDPTATLRALGRVVSYVPPDGESLPVGRFHLGIAFEAIHEEDREALIRYTFRIQRAQLRDRKS
jgi:hypothetical protein